MFLIITNVSMFIVKFSQLVVMIFGQKVIYLLLCFVREVGRVFDTDTSESELATECGKAP